jgi:hypothetical protein
MKAKSAFKQTRGGQPDKADLSFLRLYNRIHYYGIEFGIHTNDDGTDCDTDDERQDFFIMQSIRGIRSLR